MLTDKQIEEVAQPFIRECGDYSAYEEAIPYRYIEDFARAIEKAVLFDELQTWTTSRWFALQETSDERCGKCGRMFWHHIKEKMNLEA